MIWVKRQQSVAWLLFGLGLASLSLVVGVNVRQKQLAKDNNKSLDRYTLLKTREALLNGTNGQDSYQLEANDIIYPPGEIR